MADAFDPDAFAAVKAASPPAAAPAVPVSGFDPAAFEALKKAQTPVAAPTSWLDTAKEGVKGFLRGPLDFVGDMGEAVAGPFGPSHHAGNLMADLGLGERPKPSEPFSTQMHKAAGIDSANPGYAGSIGENLGNPATYFGPGGWLAKTIMGAASGAGGEAAAQAAEGTGYEGLARAAGSVAAGPVAGRIIKPTLAPEQQMLADHGVTQMTPGQLSGGLLKSAEDKLTSVPILGDFIKNARGRSVESFNRSVANQALDPIGERVAPRTAAGHEMVGEVADKLDEAYNRLLPNLQFVPDRPYAAELNRIHQQEIRTLPPQMQAQFESILDAKLGPQVAVPAGTVLGTPGTPRAGFAPMTGQRLKAAESDLSKRASSYMGSADADQRTMGIALNGVVRAIRENLERVNPDQAAELRDINRGWAMYSRIRDAASRGTEGVFMPSQLLAAVKRGDKSVGKGSFARGDAMMQDFAEAGQSVLPSKVPDSGTPGRSLMAAGAMGYFTPKILAATGAASVPYLRPATYLINRYASPTTGLRADYARAAQGPAGLLRPATQNPFGDQTNPYAP